MDYNNNYHESLLDLTNTLHEISNNNYEIRFENLVDIKSSILNNDTLFKNFKSDICDNIFTEENILKNNKSNVKIFYNFLNNIYIVPKHEGDDNTSSVISEQYLNQNIDLPIIYDSYVNRDGNGYDKKNIIEVTTNSQDISSVEINISNPFIFTTTTTPTTTTATPTPTANIQFYEITSKSNGEIDSNHVYIKSLSEKRLHITNNIEFRYSLKGSITMKTKNTFTFPKIIELNHGGELFLDTSNNNLYIAFIFFKNKQYITSFENVEKYNKYYYMLQSWHNNSNPNTIPFIYINTYMMRIIITNKLLNFQILHLFGGNKISTFEEITTTTAAAAGDDATTTTTTTTKKDWIEYDTKNSTTIDNNNITIKQNFGISYEDIPEYVCIKNNKSSQIEYLKFDYSGNNIYMENKESLLLLKHFKFDSNGFKARGFDYKRSGFYIHLNQFVCTLNTNNVSYAIHLHYTGNRYYYNTKWYNSKLHEIENINDFVDNNFIIKLTSVEPSVEQNYYCIKYDIFTSDPISSVISDRIAFRGNDYTTKSLGYVVNTKEKYFIVVRGEGFLEFEYKEAERYVTTENIDNYILVTLEENDDLLIVNSINGFINYDDPPDLWITHFFTTYYTTTTTDPNHIQSLSIMKQNYIYLNNLYIDYKNDNTYAAIFPRTNNIHIQLYIERINISDYFSIFYDPLLLFVNVLRELYTRSSYDLCSNYIDDISSTVYDISYGFYDAQYKNGEPLKDIYFLNETSFNAIDFSILNNNIRKIISDLRNTIFLNIVEPYEEKINKIRKAVSISESLIYAYQIYHRKTDNFSYDIFVHFKNINKTKYVYIEFLPLNDEDDHTKDELEDSYKDTLDILLNVKNESNYDSIHIFFIMSINRFQAYVNEGKYKILRNGEMDQASIHYILFYTNENEKEENNVYIQEKHLLPIYSRNLQYIHIDNNDDVSYTNIQSDILIHLFLFEKLEIDIIEVILDEIDESLYNLHIDYNFIEGKNVTYKINRHHHILPVEMYNISQTYDICSNHAIYFLKKNHKIDFGLNDNNNIYRTDIGDNNSDFKDIIIILLDQKPFDYNINILERFQKNDNELYSNAYVTLYCINKNLTDSIDQFYNTIQYIADNNTEKHYNIFNHNEFSNIVYEFQFEYNKHFMQDGITEINYFETTEDNYIFLRMEPKSEYILDACLETNNNDLIIPEDFYYIKCGYHSICLHKNIRTIELNTNLPDENIYPTKDICGNDILQINPTTTDTFGIYPMIESYTMYNICIDVSCIEFWNKPENNDALIFFKNILNEFKSQFVVYIDCSNGDYNEFYSNLDDDICRVKLKKGVNNTYEIVSFHIPTDFNNKTIFLISSINSIAFSSIHKPIAFNTTDIQIKLTITFDYRQAGSISKIDTDGNTIFSDVYETNTQEEVALENYIIEMDNLYNNINQEYTYYETIDLDINNIINNDVGENSNPKFVNDYLDLQYTFNRFKNFKEQIYYGLVHIEYYNRFSYLLSSIQLYKFSNEYSKYLDKKIDNCFNSLEPFKSKWKKYIGEEMRTKNLISDTFLEGGSWTEFGVYPNVKVEINIGNFYDSDGINNYIYKYLIELLYHMNNAGDTIKMYTYSSLDIHYNEIEESNQKIKKAYSDSVKNRYEYINQLNLTLGQKKVLLDKQNIIPTSMRLSLNKLERKFIKIEKQLIKYKSIIKQKRKDLYKIYIDNIISFNDEIKGFMAIFINRFETDIYKKINKKVLDEFYGPKEITYLDKWKLNRDAVRSLNYLKGYYLAMANADNLYLHTKDIHANAQSSVNSGGENASYSWNGEITTVFSRYLMDCMFFGEIETTDGGPMSKYRLRSGDSINSNGSYKDFDFRIEFGTDSQSKTNYELYILEMLRRFRHYVKYDQYRVYNFDLEETKTHIYTHKNNYTDSLGQFVNLFAYLKNWLDMIMSYNAGSFTPTFIFEDNTELQDIIDNNNDDYIKWWSETYNNDNEFKNYFPTYNKEEKTIGNYEYTLNHYHHVMTLYWEDLIHDYALERDDFKDTADDVTLRNKWFMEDHVISGVTRDMKRAYLGFHWGNFTSYFDWEYEEYTPLLLKHYEVAYTARNNKSTFFPELNGNEMINEKKIDFGDDILKKLEIMINIAFCVNVYVNKFGSYFKNLNNDDILDINSSLDINTSESLDENIVFHDLYQDSLNVIEILYFDTIHKYDAYPSSNYNPSSNLDSIKNINPYRLDTTILKDNIHYYDKLLVENNIDTTYNVFENNLNIIENSKDNIQFWYNKMNDVSGLIYNNTYFKHDINFKDNILDAKVKIDKIENNLSNYRSYIGVVLDIKNSYINDHNNNYFYLSERTIPDNYDKSIINNLDELDLITNFLRTTLRYLNYLDIDDLEYNHVIHYISSANELLMYIISLVNYSYSTDDLDQNINSIYIVILQWINNIILILDLNVKLEYLKNKKNKSPTFENTINDMLSYMIVDYNIILPSIFLDSILEDSNVIDEVIEINTHIKNNIFDIISIYKKKYFLNQDYETHYILIHSMFTLFKQTFYDDYDLYKNTHKEILLAFFRILKNGLEYVLDLLKSLIKNYKEHIENDKAHANIYHDVNFILVSLDLLYELTDDINNIINNMDYGVTDRDIYKIYSHDISGNSLLYSIENIRKITLVYFRYIIVQKFQIELFDDISGILHDKNNLFTDFRLINNKNSEMLRYNVSYFTPSNEDISLSVTYNEADLSFISYKHMFSELSYIFDVSDISPSHDVRQYNFELTNDIQLDNIQLDISNNTGEDISYIIFSDISFVLDQSRITELYRDKYIDIISQIDPSNSTQYNSPTFELSLNIMFPDTSSSLQNTFDNSLSILDTSFVQFINNNSSNMIEGEKIRFICQMRERYIPFHKQINTIITNISNTLEIDIDTIRKNNNIYNKNDIISYPDVLRPDNNYYIDNNFDYSLKTFIDTIQTNWSNLLNDIDIVYRDATNLNPINPGDAENIFPALLELSNNDASYNTFKSDVENRYNTIQNNFKYENFISEEIEYNNVKDFTFKIIDMLWFLYETVYFVIYKYYIDGQSGQDYINNNIIQSWNINVFEIGKNLNYILEFLEVINDDDMKLYIMRIRLYFILLFSNSSGNDNFMSINFNTGDTSISISNLEEEIKREINNEYPSFKNLESFITKLIDMNESIIQSSNTRYTEGILLSEYAIPKYLYKILNSKIPYGNISNVQFVQLPYIRLIHILDYIYENSHIFRVEDLNVNDLAEIKTVMDSMKDIIIDISNINYDIEYNDNIENKEELKKKKNDNYDTLSTNINTIDTFVDNVDNILTTFNVDMIGNPTFNIYSYIAERKLINSPSQLFDIFKRDVVFKSLDIIIQEKEEGEGEGEQKPTKITILDEIDSEMYDDIVSFVKSL